MSPSDHEVTPADGGVPECACGCGEGVEVVVPDALGRVLEVSTMVSVFEADRLRRYPSPQTIPGNKVCFAAPFNIYVGDQVYASYYANTIVSKSLYVVVTAYLSNNSQASACHQDD